MSALAEGTIRCEHHPGCAAIAFDLDGVLLDTSEAHAAAFAQVQAEFELPHVEYAELAGRATDEVFAELLDVRLGSEASGLIATATRRKRELARLTLAAAELNPGAAELLGRLSQEGAPYALVTSAGGAALERSRELLDFSTFEFVLDRSSVQRAKPHPEIYLLAAQRFGVRPDQMVVVEDSVAGLAAAQAAGACVWHLTSAHGPEPSDERSCVTIASLEEGPAI